MGVLTDAYDAILVEIDLDYFDKYKEILTGPKGSKVIPLRYKVLNCQSASPSLREGLMHFFFKAIVDDNALKIRQERMVIFREYLRHTTEELRRNSWPQSIIVTEAQLVVVQAQETQTYLNLCPS